MGFATTWIKDLTDFLEASVQDDHNDTLSKDIQDADLNEKPGDRQVFNQLQLDTIKPENTRYEKDFPPLQGNPTTSTPLSAQSPPTIVEVKYAPSSSDQIDFHSTWCIWCETKRDDYYSMVFQHHHTPSGHTRPLDLSLLAHHTVNHHAYQLELARRAFILDTEIDTDKDGFITRKEFGSASLTPFVILHKEGDGKLSHQEYEWGFDVFDFMETVLSPRRSPKDP
jgi:hypothetical protein